MKRRIGILTSGGDCPGLNAAIRGVARAAYELFDAEIIGIRNGYGGLIEGEYQEMSKKQFSGILTLGGTILGTSRQPFRNMRVLDERGVDKVAAMKRTYKDLKLDCLVTLGGNGARTRRPTCSARRASTSSACPRPSTTTSTAPTSPSASIRRWISPRRSSTASTPRPPSHGRCMVIEIMGNKAGWLTLYSGLAGGADVILLPEVPYDIKKVAEAVEARAKSKEGLQHHRRGRGRHERGRGQDEEEGARGLPRHAAL